MVGKNILFLYIVLVFSRIFLGTVFTIRVGQCVERVAAKDISENERLTKVTCNFKFYGTTKLRGK